MFRDEVGQQIPVLCFWRTLVAQPAPLRSGHRFATERVFSHQTRAFELLLDLRELERYICNESFQRPLKTLGK